MNKLLIVGSNSFSGQDFARVCLSYGYEVFCVSRSPQKPQYLLSYDREKVLYYQYNLNFDLTNILSIINIHKITHIINFAAQGTVEHSWDNPGHWYNTNVLSTVKLIQKLSKLDFIEKYIQVSTPEVYGNTSNRIYPNKNYNPTTPYAASKAAIDVFLELYGKQNDIPISFVRSSNVYGARQQFYRIIPKCIASIILGKQIPLHGGGKSSRDFIHISDVSDAELAILCNGTTREIYHISTEKETTILKLVQTICRLMDKDYHNHIITTEDRIGKDNAYILDSTTTRALGWTPQIDLINGITNTIHWMNHIDLSLTRLEYEHKE